MITCTPEGLVPEGERVDSKLHPQSCQNPLKVEDKTQIEMAIAPLLYK